MTQFDLISSVFRKEVLAMAAYKVADAQGLIKLDAMENPYNWPEDIKKDWLEALKDCPLNRYPDPEARHLVQTIKHLNQISDQFDVLLGNGSDEIIQLLLMALPVTASVLAPAPGFVMYKQLSDCLGLNYQGIPLLADTFDLDLPAMLAAIEKQQPSVIFLAYPNNPTGNLFSETSVLEIIKTAKGLVVIDEAYAPFANASFINTLAQYYNLLVINSLTQISADFALSNKTLFDQQTQKICAERAVVFKQLNELDGITAYPSAANFILFRTPENKASEIFLSIRQQGVLIKNMSAQGGLLSDCLRVTIGKPEENQAFLAALRKSL
jgi:histidinol-phosphate aminotransferase